MGVDPHWKAVKPFKRCLPMVSFCVAKPQRGEENVKRSETEQKETDFNTRVKKMKKKCSVFLCVTKTCPCVCQCVCVINAEMSSKLQNFCKHCSSTVENCSVKPRNVC